MTKNKFKYNTEEIDLGFGDFGESSRLAEGCEDSLQLAKNSVSSFVAYNKDKI